MALKAAMPLPGPTCLTGMTAKTDNLFPKDKLIILQKACQETDDEMRWLLALISDTGMRLSEAAGLHRDDIILDAPTPHINLTAHPWRRLKTKSSARHIPLVGTSLWAA